MRVELNTHLTQEEKDILKCSDVSVKLIVDTDMLFYECRKDGKLYTETIENPNRMIGIGGYYLLELKDEIGEWNMGVQKQDDLSYLFWGNYGNLKDAYEAL